MKSILITYRRLCNQASLLAGACIWLASGAHSAELSGQQAHEFLNAKGCNACHDVSAGRLAPPFAVIALRYAGRSSDAREVLAQKVIHGGAGNWGLVPMVSNPHLTEAEARAIVAWILTLRDDKPTS